MDGIRSMSTVACTLAWLVLLLHNGVGALECFQCQNVQRASDCHYSRECPANQVCYTNKTGSGNNVFFSLGCTPQQECFKNWGSIVGRAVGDREIRSGMTSCGACCRSDYCNKYLCMDSTTALPPTTIRSTPPPPTTTQGIRHCRYESWENSGIAATNYAEPASASIHRRYDLAFCQRVCEQAPALSVMYECWAVTYSAPDRCHLFYGRNPLYINYENRIHHKMNGTTLYLKRCSNAPIMSSVAPTSPKPVSTVESTTSRVVNVPPMQFVTTCRYGNQTFTKGDRWTESCRYKCQCVDNMQDLAVCYDTCKPHLPSGCVLLTVAGRCCPVVYCATTTRAPSTYAPHFRK